MTSFHQMLAVCPICLNEETLTLWDEIDASTDPDLREKLLRKTLQSLECRNCGHSTLIAAPLIYRDPALGLLIECRPDLTPEDLAKRLVERQSEVFDEGTTNRLTATMNDLIEKIHIFEAGLDDQALEIIKLAVADQQSGDQLLQDLRFVSCSGDELLFVLKREDDWFHYALPMEAYRNANRILMETEPDAPAQTVFCIDRTYARVKLDQFASAMSSQD